MNMIRERNTNPIKNLTGSIEIRKYVEIRGKKYSFSLKIAGKNIQKNNIFLKKEDFLKSW
jgi:uncharacterized membrane protein